MRILKILGISIISLIAVLFLTTVLVIRLVPAFGNAPDENKRAKYQSSSNFQTDKFINLLPTKSACGQAF